MNHRKFALALGGSLLMGLGGVANANELENIRAELRATQNRVAELEGRQTANWLDQRRAEEVKALIREVLSDADTRASLMADGAVAGHNGRNFYLGSADGSFQLRISGGIQVRWIHNFENFDNPTPAVGTAGTPDADDGGFDIARTKVNLAGHITAGRKWDYEIGLALGVEPDTTSGDLEVEDVRIGTALSDQIRVDVGLFKLPFLREELTSYSRQLAVERSLTNDFFSLNRSEQVQVSYKSDMLLVRASLSDGANNGAASSGSATGHSAVGLDNVEFAVTARADFKFSGDFSQMDDFTAWSGQPTGIFAGAAIHYETGDGNQTAGGIPSHGNYFSWTFDGSLEMNGLSVYAAIIGGHIDADASGVNAPDEQRDMFGAVAQVSYNINDKIEPFVRADWTDLDTETVGFDSTVFAVTFGANYYFAKSHDAKLTLDVMWIADGPDNFADIAAGANNFGGSVANSNTLQGFSAGDAHGEDNVIVRVQFQLLY